MELTPTTIFTTGCIFSVISVAGLAGWLEAVWFKDPGPFAANSWHGYNFNVWFGLVAFTIFCPLAVALLVVAVTQGSRVRFVEEAVRWNSIRVSLGTFFLFVGTIGLYWSRDMMQCLAVFCVGTEAYQDPGNVTPLAGYGWLATVGLTGFFSLVPIGFVLIRASWSALRQPEQQSLSHKVSAGGMLTGSSRFSAGNANNTQNILVDSSPLLPAHGSSGGTQSSFSNDGNSPNAKHPQQQQEKSRFSINDNVNDLSSNMLNNNNNNFEDVRTKPVTHSAFWWRTVIIFVALLFFSITTLYLPNSWEYFSASRIASNAALIVTNVYNGTNGTCAYNDIDGIPSTCTDFPWAIFPTGNIVITKDLVLKIYPSNIFFFVYLMIMLLGAAFVHSSVSRVSGFTRLRIQPQLGWHYSYAEVCGWLLTVGMFILFCIYWFHDHNFDTLGGRWTTGIAKSERVARAFGQIAVAFMGLLLFPSSRNSVLHSTLGTSWESLLRVHRILGYCMLICALIHMIAWWVKYAEIGQFPTDIISVPMTLPESADNFTVPLNNITTWLLILCMGVFALEPIRRWWFELFYYSHLVAAYAAIPAVLWHAAAGWEYLLPGLTVWFMDRIVRFSRSSRVVSIISTKACGDGVTELRFHQKDLVVRPGQYVFINIAELSLLQWHPFSVSSINNKTGCFSLHIKAMPPNTNCFLSASSCCSGNSNDNSIKNATSTSSSGINALGDSQITTWTQQLRNAVQMNIPLTISVDGAYGPEHELSEFDTVILVAGGIGITPCAAIVENLRNQQDVKLELHWCLRELDLGCEFVPMLSQGENSNYSATLYSSKDKNSPAEELTRRSGGFQVKTGRPKWNELMSNLTSSESSPSDSSRILVFACGPTQLVDECAQAAVDHGCTFHCETFFL